MLDVLKSNDNFTMCRDLRSGDLVATGEKPIEADTAYYEAFFKSCESIVSSQLKSPHLSFGGTYKMCEAEAGDLGISPKKLLHIQVLNTKLALLNDNNADLSGADKELERLTLLKRTVPELNGQKAVEPVKLSTLIDKGLAICSEHSIMAQTYLQRQGIESYLCRAKLFQDTKNGITADAHHFLVINDNNRMFVYDPLNIKSTGRPRVYNTGLTKDEFMQKAASKETFILDFEPETPKHANRFDIGDTHHLGYGLFRRSKISSKL